LNLHPHLLSNSLTAAQKWVHYLCYLSGVHPASYPIGTRALFLWVKWPGCVADHSPPSSAEVKKAWSYNSTPQYAFMAWCSIKAQ